MSLFPDKNSFFFWFGNNNCIEHSNKIENTKRKIWRALNTIIQVSIHHSRFCEDPFRYFMANMHIQSYINIFKYIFAYMFIYISIYIFIPLSVVHNWGICFPSPIQLRISDSLSHVNCGLCKISHDLWQQKVEKYCPYLALWLEFMLSDLQTSPCQLIDHPFLRLYICSLYSYTLIYWTTVSLMNDVVSISFSRPLLTTLWITFLFRHLFDSLSPWDMLLEKECLGHRRYLTAMYKYIARLLSRKILSFDNSTNNFWVPMIPDKL